jgi:uncharacterized membrane protein YraQ (UPF0718 family)
MVNDNGLFLVLGALLAILIGVCIYLYRDNAALRRVIEKINEEKNNLAEQLRLSIEHQAATLQILERVLQSEMLHVRDDERVRIFAAALKDIKVVEKAVTVNVANVGHDQNKVDIGAGAEVGQAASGRGNDQKQV